MLFKKNSQLIQVAGVLDWPEAQLLVDEGVDAIGFPFGLPVHKEDLTILEIEHIVRKIPNHIEAVLITYFDNADRIHEVCQKTRIKTIQIHGDISYSEIQELKSINPEYKLIKSLVVKANNLSELKQSIIQFSPFIHGFITDTHDPITGADGATGKTHDWNVSRELVEDSPHRVILAGGLKPQNVGEAIKAARPAGVDVHTGIEGKDGRKDVELLKAFIREARLAFSAINGN